MAIKFKSDYNFGDSVRLKHDKNNEPRMLVGVSLRNGMETYNLMSGVTDSWHYIYEFEKAESDKKEIKGFNN